MSWQFHIAAHADDFALDAKVASEARVLGLFGASGSGKTTLLECLAGFRPCTGTQTIGGVEWQGASSSVGPAARRAGWVPQDGSLFPHLNVRGNLEFARRPSAQFDRVVEVLGIGNILARMPGALSGGERQRVALARALCSDPAVLLLDEPLGAVDLPRRARVFRHLLAARDAFDLPMLYVSHDPAEMLAMADEVVLLDNGRVAAQGAPRALLGNASAMRLLDRLGFENVFRVEAQEAVQAGRAFQVHTPGGEVLVAPPAPTDFDRVGWLAVRAEDVLLANAEPKGLSARNCLAGEVVAVDPFDEHLLVRVRAQEEWVATLTRRAVSDLGLSPGSPAWVVVKTHAFHWLAE